MDSDYKTLDIKHPAYVGDHYSNDASASSFGWNFQYNAGIFLFLKYGEDVSSIEMENDMQDIDLLLRDGSHIYAQAKSALDYSQLKQSDKDIKIKDAIVSLSNTAAKNLNAKFVFISNIKEPFKDEDCISKMRVISYSKLLKSSQDYIDSLFKQIKNQMATQIEEVRGDKQLSPNKKEKKINKITCDIVSVELLEKNKNKLYISTIIPFNGGDERFESITEQLISFLDKLSFSRDKIHLVRLRYLDFLRLKFETNSGVAPSSSGKTMKASELIWPISSILIYDNRDFSVVKDYLSFSIDPSNIEKIKEYFSEESFLYHTRFEFSNKVIQRFIQFKSEYKNIDNIMMLFLNEYWKEFSSEFNDGKLNDENLEYLTKYFLFKCITVREDVNKLIGWLGDDRL